jgi:Rieske Fe-S protein
MKISRRDFVQGVAGTAAVASGVVLVGCGNDVQPAPILPEPVQVDPTGRITLALKVNDNGTIKDHYPDLAPVGGSITVPIAAAPGQSAAGKPKSLLVVHVTDDPAGQQYIAVDSECPHQGCPLGYSPQDQLIECPCHASRFSAGAGEPAGNTDVGVVVHGPAMFGPPSKKTTLSPDGNVLVIQVGAHASFQLSKHPELQTPGTAVVLTPPEVDAPIVVFRKDAATLEAFSAICTHQGCTVFVDQAAMDLSCPCHGSVFTFEGQVVNGPAAVPLPMLTVTMNGDIVTVG